MARKNSITMRTDPELSRMLKDVRSERLRLGLDKEPVPLPRLTLAITRIPNIKDVLIRGKIK